MGHGSDEKTFGRATARQAGTPVFIGLVHGDPGSYLWLRGKHWTPELPSKTAGDFTMADLLRFVGDISPIDGVTTI